MRSIDEVMAMYEKLRARRLSQRKSKYLGRYYMNCHFNIRQRVKGKGKCGFCQNRKVLKHFNGGPFVCDEDGPADHCEHFTLKNTEESVEREFREILASPARCGNEYPKLAILIWFLQSAPCRTRWKRFKTCLLQAIRSVWTLLIFRWW